MPRTNTLKKGNSSTNPHRIAKKEGQRSKSTIMRLNMYKNGKAIRNKDGEVVGGPLLMKTQSGGKEMARMARIQPDRRWFGNTRTMSQTELDKFRAEMTLKEADPYSMVLRRKKIPMALLKDSEKVAAANILEVESFNDTFGKKSNRKRPKLDHTVNDYAALAAKASDQFDEFEKTQPKINPETADDGTILDHRSNDLFSKGQSKRIWAELYKVLDSSDVILQVIDARNVPGTRCEHIEKHIKKNAAHKHMVIIINKCDLVPSWVTRKWVKILSSQFPTLAFHASITNCFGKGALISLLRQFSKLHSDRRQISVGVIGYPNTGKSSVINALMGKKACKAAPVPGETKVWQYITLMKRIFLIDSPGVVYNVGDDDVDTVLKGVVRAERLEEPTEFVPAILRRVKKEYIQKQYLLKDWTDHWDFLEKLAKRNGKLMKGGEPDTKSVSVSVINDWQRGKLPYFVAPPRDKDDNDDDEDEEEEEIEEGDELNQNQDEDEEEEEEQEDEKEEKSTKGKRKYKETKSKRDRSMPSSEFEYQSRGGDQGGAETWDDI